MIVEDLYVFATRYRIALADVYVLPALFERSAEKVGMSPKGLLSASINDRPLGEYMAEAARKVAEADRRQR